MPELIELLDDEIDDNDETRGLEMKSYLCNQIQNVRNYDVTRRNLYTGHRYAGTMIFCDSQNFT